MVSYTKKINYTKNTFIDQFLKITSKIIKSAGIGEHAECMVHSNQYGAQNFSFKHITQTFVKKIGLMLQQLLTLPFAMCNGYSIPASKPPRLIESMHIAFVVNTEALKPITFTDILFLDYGKNFYISCGYWFATTPSMNNAAYSTLTNRR